MTINSCLARTCPIKYWFRFQVVTWSSEGCQLKFSPNILLESPCQHKLLSYSVMCGNVQHSDTNLLHSDTNLMQTCWWFDRSDLYLTSDCSFVLFVDINMTYLFDIFVYLYDISIHICFDIFVYLGLWDLQQVFIRMYILWTFHKSVKCILQTYMFCPHIQ